MLILTKEIATKVMATIFKNLVEVEKYLRDFITKKITATKRSAQIHSKGRLMLNDDFALAEKIRSLIWPYEKNSIRKVEVIMAILL